MNARSAHARDMRGDTNFEMIPSQGAFYLFFFKLSYFRIFV